MDSPDKNAQENKLLLSYNSCGSINDDHYEMAQSATATRQGSIATLERAPNKQSMGFTVLPLSVLAQQQQPYASNQYRTYSSKSGGSQRQSSNTSMQSSVSMNYRRSTLIESQRKKKIGGRKKSIKQLMKNVDQHRLSYQKPGSCTPSPYEHPPRKTSTHSQNQITVIEAELDSHQDQQQPTTSIITDFTTIDPKIPLKPQPWPIPPQNSFQRPPQPFSAKQRINQIADCIETDNFELFHQQKITTSDLCQMRFEYDMNMLQLICHEESLEILKLLLNYLRQNQLDLITSQITRHRDSHLGSQAIHLAAATGNHRILAILIEDFGADCRQLNGKQQTVLHCASQRYEGIASIFKFSRQYSMQNMVNAKEWKGATALHFAAIGLLIKNAQALIKLGADVNAVDSDGNTPMHLALDRLFYDSEQFEMVKNIVKELIFSGARRDILNYDLKTPNDLLNELKDSLYDEDFKKMLYLLTPPRGNKFLRMTRPIEKVERHAGCQVSMMLFNLLILALFLFFGVNDYLHRDPKTQRDEEQIVILACTGFFSVMAVIFYFLTKINPGYVPQQPAFLQLLDKLIEENYHLDYVCVPCETLRPENADHCNFCNRCVQKFDHHCVFVNNCLGYRNHKWFLLFLLSFTIYMLGLLTHSVFQIVMLLIVDEKKHSQQVVVFNLTVQLFFVFVVFLHSPIVVLQLQSQIGKLCRRGDDVQDRGSRPESTVNDEELTSHRSSSNPSENGHAPVSKPKRTFSHSAFCKNIGTIFRFRPQTQDYLYQMLFKQDQGSTSQFGGLEMIKEEEENSFLFSHAENLSLRKSILENRETSPDNGILILSTRKGGINDSVLSSTQIGGGGSFLEQNKSKGFA